MEQPHVPLKTKRLPSKGAHGIILVTRGGKIRFMGLLAARWLKEAVPKGKPRLPRAVTRWVADGAEDPLCWPANGRYVFVSVGDHTRKGSLWLILEECGALSPKVTAEDRAMLCWVSYGKTDEEIAGLMALKMGTVKKRLQRMYNKFGLSNRAAAAAFFQGGPPPGDGH